MKVRQLVDEATKQAKSEPEVGPEELAGDVYSYCPPEHTQIRGLHPQGPLTHINVAQRN